MRIPLLLSLLIVGCSESTTKVSTSSTTASPASASTTSSPTTSIDSQPASAAPNPWGGLRVQFSGVPLSDASEVFVLLHGHGASSRDILAVAPYLGEKSRCFIVPQGPVTLPDGGHSWSTKEQGLEKSKSKIVALINQVRDTHPHAQICVGGFSQGASLTASLLTETDLPIKRFVLFSPGSSKLTDEDLPSDIHPVVFLSHGRQDKPRSFANAERLRDLIQSKGGTVDWHPFDDGHTIPIEILRAARRFLDDRSSSSHQSSNPEE